jgi:hypothetical protein
MIRAKIKSLEIIEVPDLDPAKYVPDDFEHFGCTFGLTVGPADSEGGELFYLTVCSPNWLATQCKREGFMWGRHHMIVPEYDLKAITAIVTKFVENCSGDSWPEVAAKLSQIAAWEFEDYKP